MQEDLVVLMLKALVAKLKTQSNVPYAPRLMDFYVAVLASLPKTSEIMSSGMQTLARKTCGHAKNELKLPFIVAKDTHVLRHLDAILGSLKARGREHASITIAIDGTAS
jgi:hypothetical protein